MPERSLRERALALLARREHGREELRRKLQPHAGEADDLPALLDDLTARGWLSDARFAEQLAHVRQGRFGARRVLHELREKGVAEEAIAAVMPELKDGELETARAVWQKKFGTPPADAAEKARQMRFLAARGFSHETVRRVLNTCTDTDEQ
jgi:regulatory protein